MAAVVIVGSFWIVLALTGGSSRADVGSLLLLRPIAVLAATALFLLPVRSDWTPVRVPLLLLAAFAATMLIQLVPLPSQLIDHLPGRLPFTTALSVVDAGTHWSTLSVTPDRTWNSLIALIVPATVLIGYARLPGWARAATLPLLIALGVASALFGMVQMLGGKDSPLYVYRLTHNGFPVGLLANRNHQAALLAVMLPAISVWSMQRDGRWLNPTYRAAAAVILAFFFIPVLLVTWSRAGLVLLAFLLPAALLLRPRPRDPAANRRWWLSSAAVTISIAVLLAALFVSGRDTSITRLLSGGPVQADARFDFEPVAFAIARAGFPFGYGYGSFDPVFRTFEPDAILRTAYVNNAHNDLIEVAATGGLLGLAVIGALLWWAGRRALAAFRNPATSSQTLRARAAALMAVGLLAASLADYPLRTPLLGGVFALLMAWLGEGPTLADRARS